MEGSDASYLVHANLLYHHAPTIQNAITDVRWIEDSVSSFRHRFRQCQGSTLQLYVAWIYTHQLTDFFTVHELSMDKVEDVVLLFNCAEEAGNKKLQKEIVKHLCTSINGPSCVSGGGLVDPITKYCAHDCALFKLMLDTLASRGTSEEVETAIAFFSNRRELITLCQALAKQRSPLGRDLMANIDEYLNMV